MNTHHEQQLRYEQLAHENSTPNEEMLILMTILKGDSGIKNVCKYMTL